jgi:hypothetical protein
MYTYPSYLSHHGILGMHWGIRRFQRTDGSLTQKGKSRRELYLEDKYKKEGLTSKESADQAAKKIKAERVLAATAAVAATALIAYAAYKHYNFVADKVIDKDTLIKTLSNNSNKDFSKPFYGAINKYDISRYEGFYGKALNDKIIFNKKLDGVYQSTIKVQKPIKIASEKNSISILRDLVNGDSDYKNRLIDKLEVNKAFYDKDPLYSKSSQVLGKGLSSLKSGKVNKDAYEALNLILPSHDGASVKVANGFYSALKSHGYGAIKDINDMKFSGYNTKSPVVVFDGVKANADSVRKLGAKEIETKFSDENFKAFNESLIKSGSSILATSCGIGAAAKGYGKNRKINSDSSKVGAYRKEHPNTKKSF